MKTKIGINSKDYLPQRFAHKDPRPELPFEKSEEDTCLWQFGVIITTILVLALTWL